MINTSDSSIWIEKYRPQLFGDMILSSQLKMYFEKCILERDIPHLLLYGRAGIGKTSIGKVLAKELNADFLYINGSKERTIDVLRDTIDRFATTYSDSNLWEDGATVKKIIFIDECEKITFQESLKVILEEMESNCRFILATNNISSIIDPIKDERCHTFNIEPTEQEDRKQLAHLYLNRLRLILQNEKIQYDDKVLFGIVKRTFPSLRKAISTCHKTYMVHGKLVGDDLEFDDLIDHRIVEAINNKDIIAIRKIVSNIDANQFFREFYETFDKYISEEDYYGVASLFGEFHWRNSRHDDIESNLFTFLVMLSQKYKLKMEKI